MPRLLGKQQQNGGPYVATFAASPTRRAPGSASTPRAGAPVMTAVMASISASRVTGVGVRV